VKNNIFETLNQTLMTFMALTFGRFDKPFDDFRGFLTHHLGKSLLSYVKWCGKKKKVQLIN
jgi:hypothetical protein